MIGEEAANILAGRTAIVVEDEGITQLQVRRALEAAGVKVVGVAADGVTAVQLALQERPDLVLMDINMPGNTNGLEATRQILAQFDTCVIVLTAYNDFQPEAITAGASGYITKPVTYQTLIPGIKTAYAKFRTG